MDIINEVKKLNLPIGKYVVVGGGPMAAKIFSCPAEFDDVNRNCYDAP